MRVYLTWDNTQQAKRLQRDTASIAARCEHRVVVDNTCWECGAVDVLDASDKRRLATLEHDATGENVPFAGGYEN